MREPVGIVMDEYSTTVVCKDGSVWAWNEYKWDELVPIPGSLRDKSKKRRTKKGD